MKRYSWFLTILLSLTINTFPLFALTTTDPNQYIPFDLLNYEYTILFVHTIPPEISLDDSLDEVVVKLGEERKTVEHALTEGFKQTLFPIIQVLSPSFLTPGTDIQKEILKGISFFADELRKINIKDTLRYQIHIIPRLSEDLRIKNIEGEVPLQRFYAKDKFPVYTIMGDHEGESTYYKGMAKVMEHNTLKNPNSPYLLTLLLDINLRKNVNDSNVSAQAVIGMPTSQKKIPFEKDNPQIRLTHIKFPTITGNTNLMVSAFQYPCAFLTIDYTLDKRKPLLMHINFGPLGSYSEGKWQRPPGIDYKTMVPKLVGIPKLRVNAVEVDFNIFNLSMNLEKLEVVDLDLYESIGPTFLSSLKLGSFNKQDIDKQFQDEINKTIQEEIKKQKERLPQSVNDVEIINALLTKLFSIPK